MKYQEVVIYPYHFNSKLVSTCIRGRCSGNGLHVYSGSA
jgi:hypothetical protein